MKVIDVSLSFSWSCNLGIEGKCCLHTNEQALYVESLKHDFGHLFSIFRGIHWWLSKNKFVLTWFTSDVLIDRFVPEFLNSFPIIDLTMLQQSSNIVSRLFGYSIISNVEIQVRVLELHLLVKGCSSCL